MCVQAFGDPLKNPQVGQDLAAVGVNWRQFCVVRHAREKQAAAGGSVEEKGKREEEEEYDYEDL